MQKYLCESCHFITSNKFNYEKHCETQKHNFLKKEIIGNEKNARGIMCLDCDRTFLTAAGLWKHKKKCKKCPKTDNTLVEYLIQENKDLKSTMLQIIEKNDEKMTTVLKNNDEKVTNLVIELCKKSAPVTTVNVKNDNCNNMINSNNKFNLNFFLNETCKDALNLSEFITKIKSSFEDIERIGNMGYVDGTSDFIIRQLNDLGVEKRPIQCTDAKRQTLYIKENNEWTKEDVDFKNMQKLVDEVQRINLRQLPLWQKTHPNCLTSNSKFTDTYNHMSHELMGGDCNKVKLHVKDHKIFTKIIKGVAIDKQLFTIHNN